MIRIGILGYGNLGRGVEKAVLASPDMTLTAVFTRRDNVLTVGGNKTVNVKDILNYKDKIDVLMLCGGSATDLPVQGAEMLKDFNTVDSFDTHANIPEYFNKMDEVGRKNGNLGIISVGWDPGLFSMARILFNSVIPNGTTYTFWGKGVSQGHSDAIRRIDGVKNGIQYTVPQENALAAVRNGENPDLSTRQKHARVCYVVLKEGADENKVREEIVNMPNYFADYDTTVNFIGEDELKANHGKLNHGGFVIRSGNTGDNKHLMEFKLIEDSNPEFTGSVLTAYARAIYRMRAKGDTGAISVYDVPLAMISPLNAEQLRAELL